MSLTRRVFLGAGAGVLAQAQSTAPGDRINVGMIGVGSRAQQLLESIKRIDGTQIIGVCDAYKGREERAVERTGSTAKIYEDYKQILDDPAIDAVTIASPDHWHKQMVIEALHAGKDVYCEKPLTYTVDEGLEITEAVEQTGQILQVGSQDISGESSRKLREWVRSGKFGQITMIRAAYNRNSPGGAWLYPIPPDASPKTVDWQAFLGPAPKREFDLERFFRWRCYEEYSGGIATDLFVHLCTTVHFLMDATMPSEVIAMGNIYRWKKRDVPDTLNAVLRYPEGFTVNLSSTFNSSADEGYLFQILGTEGSARMQAGRQAGLVFYPESSHDSNSWIVNAWPSRLREKYYQTPEGAAELERPEKPAEEVFTADGQSSTDLHFEDFFSSMRNRKPPVEDAWAGHHAASCAHLINDSVKSGTMTRWDFKTHRQA